MQARFDDAYDEILADPVGGFEDMVLLFTELDRTSAHERAANGNKLGHLRVRALHAVIEALAVVGNYRLALEWLDEQGWLKGPDDPDEVAIMRKAECHYQLGESRAAGDLIRSLIDDQDEPMFMDLPTRFFTLVRYHQFELAHEWIERRRGTSSPFPAWSTPKGVSLLHRLEAELLLEEGLAERAMVAYDKAARIKNKDVGPVFPNGMYEALVVAGRPNLALRLLKNAPDKRANEALWTALALRAQGKTEVADILLLDLIEEERPFDEFQMLDWVLANCYSGRDILALLAEVQEFIDEGTEFNDVSYYVYGVVLAIAGRLDEAQAALVLAVQDTRRQFNGNLLDRNCWYHCVQLLNAEALVAVQPYFDPDLMPERYL